MPFEILHIFFHTYRCSYICNLSIERYCIWVYIIVHSHSSGDLKPHNIFTVPLKLIFKQRQDQKNDYQVFLSHFKPVLNRNVYADIRCLATWPSFSINMYYIKHFLLLYDSKPRGTWRVSKSLWHGFIQNTIIMLHTVKCLRYINMPDLSVFGSTFKFKSPLVLANGGFLCFYFWGLWQHGIVESNTFEMLNTVC